jgi:hypothetical protein
MWQGSCCDGYMELLVTGGAVFEMLPLIKDAKSRMPTKLIAYGGCNTQEKNNCQTAAWCLKSYAYHCDGVLPWQCIGGDASFDKGDFTGAKGAADNGNMLVVDGKRFGLNAVASNRLGAMRNGAQICELMRLLELKNNWGRTHSSTLVSQIIPLASEFKQAHADDAAALKFDELTGDQFVRLKEALLKLLAK